jgi:hypothetical protein
MKKNEELVSLQTANLHAASVYSNNVHDRSAQSVARYDSRGLVVSPKLLRLFYTLCTTKHRNIETTKHRNISHPILVIIPSTRIISYKHKLELELQTGEERKTNGA